MNVTGIMTAVRQRKGTKATELPEECLLQETNWKSYKKCVSGGKQWKKISFIVGGIVGISMGILTSLYVAILHENDLWFSNIKHMGLYSKKVNPNGQPNTMVPGIHNSSGTEMAASGSYGHWDTAGGLLGTNVSQCLSPTIPLRMVHLLEVTGNYVITRYFQIGRPDTAQPTPEVEREISFRTECGLYYSYYKQMLQAPSIQIGLHGLIYDNKTESMRTINILERMNVYQEVFISILYRIFHIKTFLEPVYFYIYTLFGLQAVFVAALYVTSWLLSGTWLSGALAAFWYITNRIDTTRVEFTIPLRENWALPIFAVQVAAITFLFRPNLRPIHERLTLLTVFISTFLFSLVWQFNQFMLLIQALVLFALDCLSLVPKGKVTWIYVIQIASLFLVCLLQFFNSMIVGSLLVSFNMSSLLARRFQNNLKTGGLFRRLGNLYLHVFSVLSLTFLVNNFIRKVIKLESDEHVFKFLKAKFGFGATRDFDANLYLCEEAFGLLPFDTFMRLSGTLVFYSYMFVLLVMTITAAAVTFHNLSGSANIKPTEKLKKSISLLKPGAAYNLVHSILFGLLALSTMRMKYLWTSHMCVFASSGLCNGDMWGLILRILHLYTPRRVSMIRYLTPILIIVYLCYKFWPGMMAELSELREFYDPDTVELMNWIKSNTPKKAVIAGSMQLLAGVKLCTGRILTNHPHYEDKSLRERTKQVYQIYARRSPEDVHRILRSFGTDFVILEDSICYEKRQRRGCRLRDLLDRANGHIMDGPGENDLDLKPSEHPRFCEGIKSNLSSYAMYFTKVFWNKTFHVYKLAKHKETL